MKKEIVLDIETTTYEKGNPFSRQNKLILGGLFDSSSTIFFREDTISNITWPDSNDLLIGFNIKFDLHWLRNYGILIKCPVWDCQLAEFLLSSQQEPFPSLNKTAEREGLGSKLDIDFENTTPEELKKYLQQDLELTYKIYLRQKERLLQAGLLPLFKLQCLDLLVLEEMEWNGMKLDTSLCYKKEKEIEQQLQEIDLELKKFHESHIPINYNSRDHLSCLLYGGIIKEEVRIPVGVFKSGKKIGEVRYKLLEYEHTLPRLIQPLKGSELLKEGFYSTDDNTLKQLRTTKKFNRLLQLILKRAEINKLRGTYYKGLPDLINKMDWKPGYLYGQFNQCIAITGRLSSSRPNLQNFAEGAKECLVTRF